MRATVFHATIATSRQVEDDGALANALKGDERTTRRHCSTRTPSHTKPIRNCKYCKHHKHSPGRCTAFYVLSRYIVLQTVQRSNAALRTYTHTARSRLKHAVCRWVDLVQRTTRDGIATNSSNGGMTERVAHHSTQSCGQASHRLYNAFESMSLPPAVLDDASGSKFMDVHPPA